MGNVTRHSLQHGQKWTYRCPKYLSLCWMSSSLKCCKSYNSQNNVGGFNLIALEVNTEVILWKSYT